MLNYDEAVDIVVDALDEILCMPKSENNAEKYANTGGYMTFMISNIYSIDAKEVADKVNDKLEKKRSKEHKAFRCSFCDTKLPATANYCFICGMKQ